MGGLVDAPFPGKKNRGTCIHDMNRRPKRYWLKVPKKKKKEIDSRKGERQKSALQWERSKTWENDQAWKLGDSSCALEGFFILHELCPVTGGGGRKGKRHRKVPYKSVRLAKGGPFAGAKYRPVSMKPRVSRKLEKRGRNGWRGERSSKLELEPEITVEEHCREGGAVAADLRKRGENKSDCNIEPGGARVRPP